MCFEAPPFAKFFLGSFGSVCKEKTLKQRQPRQKRQEEEDEEELDDEDKDASAKAGKLSNVEKNMLIIRKTLKKATRRPKMKQ